MDLKSQAFSGELKVDVVFGAPRHTPRRGPGGEHISNEDFVHYAAASLIGALHEKGTALVDAETVVANVFKQFGGWKIDLEEVRKVRVGGLNYATDDQEQAMYLMRKDAMFVKRMGDRVESAARSRAQGLANENSGSGCFIASACYASDRAWQVLLLKSFRDEVLAPRLVGRLLLSAYTSLSPPLARILSRHRFAAGLIRGFLVEPIVWIIRISKAEQVMKPKPPLTN